MASRDIEHLTQSVKEKYLLFKERMDEAGLPFIVTCTSRSEMEQLALYAQGRLTLRTVNRIRAVMCDMALISPEENRHPVTWTLASRHVVTYTRPRSDAFDIALLKYGRPHWNLKVDVNGDEIPDYIQAAEIGIGCGLTAGAFFERPDYCHFQEGA